MTSVDYILELWMSHHPISKNSTPETVGRDHQGPRRWAGVRRLRQRERRAASRAAIEIGGTSEKNSECQ